MSVAKKIKDICETLCTDEKKYTVIFDSPQGANVDLSRTEMPCCIIFKQPNGTTNVNNAHYRDVPNILFFLIDKDDRDNTAEDSDKIIERQKKVSYKLFDKIKEEKSLIMQSTQINYDEGYQQFDDGFTGIAFTLSIQERIGTNFYCK